MSQDPDTHPDQQPQPAAAQPPAGAWPPGYQPPAGAWPPGYQPPYPPQGYQYPQHQGYQYPPQGYPQGYPPQQPGYPPQQGYPPQAYYPQHAPQGYAPPQGYVQPQGYAQPPQGYAAASAAPPAGVAAPRPVIPPPMTAPVQEYHEHHVWTDESGEHVIEAPHEATLASEIHLASELEKGKRRKFGTGTFVTVLILHAVAIFLAGLYVVQKIYFTEKKKLTFSNEGVRATAQQSKHDVKMAKKKSMGGMPQAKRLTSSASNTKFTLPEIPMSSSDQVTPGIIGGGMGGTGPGFGIGGPGGGPGGGMKGGIFMALPNLMKGRCDKGDRDKLVRDSGGTPECDEAVTKSLAWLKTKQNPDGSWGTQHKPAMTGLCLLAYLGHCETPDSRAYGETVLKAMMYLIDLGLKNDGLLAPTPTMQQQTPYEHGIAAYALTESYTMSRYGTKKIPNLKEVVESAAQIIIKGQGSDFGWSYKYGPPEATGSDTSVAGWQIQALNAMRHSGLKIEGLQNCFEKGLDYLESAQDPGSKGFRYRGGAGGGTFGMTGVGCLGLIVGGRENKGGNVKDGIKFILSAAEPGGGKDTRVESLNYNSESSDLYAWYYITQVCYMRGGSAWSKWNKHWRDAVVKSQSPDGSWPAEGAPAGAHSSSGAGADAIYYRTALCTLMLEVYYRYLPATDRRGNNND